MDAPRRVAVRWPQLNIQITLEMNQDVNPTLIDVLYENLPYRSLQTMH